MTESSFPTWIIMQRHGMVPDKKGPFYGTKRIEEFLRELYSIYPGCICIVVNDLGAPGWHPQHGYEWLDMYGDNRRRHPRKDEQDNNPVGYLRPSGLELLKTGGAHLYSRRDWQANIPVYAYTAPETSTPQAAISRELLSQIVDDVFEGGIEDASVIEDIYRVIARRYGPAPQELAGSGSVLREGLLRISALRGYTGDDTGRVSGYRVAAEMAEDALARADRVLPAPETNAKPLGHISAHGFQKLQTRNHYCVSVSYAAEKEYNIPIYAGDPAPQDHVMVDVDRLARSIVTASCELDGPADPTAADTISINMKDLEAVVHRYVTAALEAPLC